jgi:hypothetical protein
MKRNLLCLLIIVGMLIVTCGNEPPEGFYEGTPEDSTAIAALLNANPELLETTDMFTGEMIDISLGAISYSDADNYFRADSVIVKQHVDSCLTRLDQRNDEFDFWFAKDTTCTVYLYDTFLFYSVHYIDQLDSGWYFWNGDTGIELDTVFSYYDVGYDSLDGLGVGKRIIFFDRDEQGDWVLKRISYGNYNFPEASQDVPVIYQAILDPDGIGPRSDTVYLTSYDTLYNGHVMDRFKATDSLLEYSDGDTVKVTLTLTTQVADSSCIMYGSCGGANRVSWTGASGNVPINGQGITNFYIEAVVQEPYYYVVPRKEYKANVWLIPIRITQ